MVSRGDKALAEATLGAFLLSAEMFLPSADPSVYPTAARPCYPAGSPLSHDWEQSEDVPQANKAAWEALSPNDTGKCQHMQCCAQYH